MNEKFFDLKREKQDRMINAALKVFAQNSYKHASTDEIVKEAAISKGLLFHYFGSKMGLYTFLFDYSVKYMLFEYSRVISPKGKDYFAIRKEMETAKLNVLRNYPYMNKFIEKALLENQLDAIEETEATKNAYMEAINQYYAQGKKGKLKKGVSDSQVEALIRYTVAGLTNDQFNDDSYQPEMLYNQINEYLDVIKKLTTEK